MKTNEIQQIKEYCWGSVVTILEDDEIRTVLTMKSGYIVSAFIATNIITFLIGFLVARV